MAKRYFLVFVGALGGLAGCGQAPETVTGSPGQVAQASLTAVQSPAPDRLLYVTDNTSNTASSITSYRLDAKGNVKPAGTLGGANTLLDGPNGIALDSTGELYVANTAANELLGFAPGANGNVLPTWKLGALTVADEGTLTWTTRASTGWRKKPMPLLMRITTTLPSRSYGPS